MTDRQFFLGLCATCAAITVTPAAIGMALTAPQPATPQAPQTEVTSKPVFIASTSYNGSVDHRVRCKMTVQNRLKDPNSFKQLDWWDESGDFKNRGILRYTATNGFGGRVQESFNCNTLTY